MSASYLGYRDKLAAHANEIGQRVAELLASDPELFVACADGLALGADAFRDHVRRAGQPDAIEAAEAIAALAQCGWCFRPSFRVWLFDPEVLGLDWGEDCLPAGVRDLRALGADAAFRTSAVRHHEISDFAATA